MKKVLCFLSALLLSLTIVRAQQVVADASGLIPPVLESAPNKSLYNKAHPLGNTGQQRGEVAHHLPEQSRNSGQLPSCYPPLNPTVTMSTQGTLTFAWSHNPANVGYTYICYDIQYREAGSSGAWIDIPDEPYNVTQYVVNNVAPCISYEAQIRTKCDCNLPPFSDWVPVQAIECPNFPPIPPTILPHNCGDPVTYTNCIGNLITNPAQQFTTIAIRDFPITVATNTFQNGVWAGTGTMALPFGNASVKVEWNNLKIAKNYRVCEGTVHGMADDPQFYPNLNPSPVPFGGEICVKPPSTPGFNAQGIHSATGLPWDEQGFGPTGKYDKQPPYTGYSPGAPFDTTRRYDPNGFDVHGIHALTGTQFNPSGCNQQGVDSLGQPCSPKIPPYSWLNTTSTPPTEEGLTFAAEVEDSLALNITAILQELKTKYQDSLTLKSAECDGIRIQMNGLLGGLGFNRAFIFGPADVYFEDGMYKKFSSRPQVLNATLNRTPNVKQLEDKHIDLYDCDKKQFYYRDYHAEIVALLANLSGVSAGILDEIKALPKDSVDLFSANSQVFMRWLRQRVGNAVAQAFLAQYGYAPLINWETEGLAETPDPSPPASVSMEFLAYKGDARYASTLLAQSLHLRPEDASFQFRQGFREINGVHRAYYLRAMAEARKMAAGPETAHDALLMPIDVSNRGVDGRAYSVYMDDIHVTPLVATCDLYIILNLPTSGQDILFTANDIEFTPFGPAPGGPMKLELGKDIYVRLNNNARLKLLQGPKTFVAFDCQGFAGMGVSADVELCREVVVPIDRVTGAVLPEPERVNGHFETYMPTLGEFFVQFDMDAFAIPGYEDVRFLIQNVTLDMSESMSPQGTPPPGYATPLAGPGGFRPQWKGFYMGNFSVRLPNKFSKDNEDITIAVEKLVIDNMGVSGQVTANNLLTLDKGSAGGWAFSVDHFELTVVMNQFRDAGFQGSINVPIFRNANNSSGQITQSDCFLYDAFLRPGNRFDFSVYSPQGQQFAVDMWKAGTVKLESCAIDLHFANNAFTALATLSGDATINGDLSPGLDMNIPKISFQNVQVSNKAPHFSPGTWSFNKDVGAQFGGFELTFSNIGMVQTASGDPALGFKALVAIGDGVTGLTAAGGFKVVGQMQEVNGRQRWIYKNFQVDQLCVDAGFQGVSNITGCLEFFEGHATYGKGFRGALTAKFEFMDGSMSVAGQFGKVNGLKYFFIDALFCGNIPLGGALNLRGVGGGVSYHMTRPDQAFSLPACAGNPSVPSGIGQTLSGITYTPDGSKGLGLRFTVAASIVKEDAFNANATFEMLFTSGGSLDKVWLYGNARFMEAMQISAPIAYTPGAKPQNNSMVSANVDLSMDFTNKHLQGKLEVFMNVNGNIVGAGPNGYMGFAEVSFKKTEWFIKVGSPGARLGLVMGIPGFGSVAQLQAYLQIGSAVDPLPPIPQEILSLTGASNLGNIYRGTGNVAGFSFGADLQLGNKDFTFLIFNAGLQARLGFDLALNNFGSDAVCAGSGSPVGINGWYAQGQVYAGVHGHIGIRVKVFGKRKTFNILNLAAAAVLQAKLPNPFWAEGAVGGEYSVLNGLIKGQCKFKFTIGQACAIENQEDVDLELPLILETAPVNGAKLVPVMSDPSVTFHYPVNSLIAVPDINNTAFRLKVDYVRLRYKGYVLPVTQAFSADKRSIVLKPGFALPARDTVYLEVRAYVDSSGHQTEVDERVVRFITGTFNPSIPPANVEGSYPMDGQYNFYRNEIVNGKGYIKLLKGQPDLLTEQGDYELLLRFQTHNGGCTTVPCDYNALDKRIQYNIPSSFFLPGKVYRMQLLLAPKADGNWGPGFVPVDPCSFDPAASGGTAPPAEGNSGNDDEASGQPLPKLLYTAYFRASQFNTFYDKIGAFEASKQYAADGTGFRNLNKTEPFDRFELFGYAGEKPLVNIRADIQTSSWIKSSSLKGLFTYFPATILGETVPLPDNKPDEAVWIGQAGDPNAAPFIGKQHYTAAPPNTATLQQFVQFDAPAALKKTYDALRQQIGMAIDAKYQQLVTGINPPCNSSTLKCDCLNSLPTTVISTGGRIIYCPNGSNGVQWTNPTPGKYPVVFSYRLPGTTQQSSIRTVELLKQ